MNETARQQGSTPVQGGEVREQRFCFVHPKVLAARTKFSCSKPERFLASGPGKPPPLSSGVEEVGLEIRGAALTTPFPGADTACAPHARLDPRLPLALV